METEIWKSHPYIEKLEVSTFGRVRTLDKVVPSGKHTQFVKGRVLKQYNRKDGYLQVDIPIVGKRPKKLVHRLVAQTFISNPNDLPEVNHLDCNRTNNHVDNLEFCTRSYNMKYREKFGISNTESIGKPLFAINLNTLEVSGYPSQSEAGRALRVYVQSINAVIKGRQKYANGYWFTNADDKAVDLTKRKLHYIDKARLTAADEASADFVSKIIYE